MTEGEVFIGFSGRLLLKVLAGIYPPETLEAIRSLAIETARAEGSDWIMDRSILLAAAEVRREGLPTDCSRTAEEEPEQNPTK